MQECNIGGSECFGDPGVAFSRGRRTADGAGRFPTRISRRRDGLRWQPAFETPLCHQCPVATAKDRNGPLGAHPGDPRADILTHLDLVALDADQRLNFLRALRRETRERLVDRPCPFGIAVVIQDDESAAGVRLRPGREAFGAVAHRRGTGDIVRVPTLLGRFVLCDDGHRGGAIASIAAG